jgi:hypothetical protein
MNAPSAGDVLTQAQATIAALRAQLKEPSATSKRAESDAIDGLAQFERSITLLVYEVRRQTEVATAREKAAAERAATDKARAEREERARHESTLRREAARSKAIDSARSYLKQRKTGT